MEFPTEEAKAKYLKEHPGADKSKHTVSPSHGGAKAPPQSSKVDPSAAHAEAAKSTTRSEETEKHFEEMQDLKKKVEDGNHSAKTKFDRTYDKIFAAGEVAEKAAEKLVKKYDSIGDGLEGEDKENSEASVQMLHHALEDWKSNVGDHHQGARDVAHVKLHQAHFTYGYAKQLEKAIRQVSRSLKGDHTLEK